MSSSGTTPSITISGSQDSKEKTIQILADDFRNELFDDNMAYFKDHQPAIYNIVKNHKCTDYRICLNADGSPNIIYLPTNNLLYYSEGQMIFNSIKHQLENIPHDIEVSPSYALQFPKKHWAEKNPYASGMYRRLFEAGPVKAIAEDESRQQFNQTFRPNFYPYLRIYGVGLGYHITQLIQSKEILSLLIYEPEIDLFYTSLYTTPWKLFFNYIEMDPGRKFSLIVAAKPEEAIKVEGNFLANNFPFIHVARWQLKTLQSDAINEFIELEKIAYNNLGQTLTAGWYEDQRNGLINSLENLIGNRKVFIKSQFSSFLRIAVVGAGPSLNQSIDYLEKHQDDFIIFACGTAITPLIKKGIIPDYHIHQERTSNTESVTSWADREIYKNIVALKLNVLTPEIDHLYENTYIFQKFNDPGSALLPEKYPVIKNTNPTVTNSGVVFAAQFVANEVYLFGVDYGAPTSGTRMHADNYVHAHRDTEKVDINSRFKLDGNFGETVITTDKLLQSHNITEIAIASHKTISWYNVGEGALIENATPIKTQDLPKTFKHSPDKKKFKQHLTQSFINDYSIDEIIRDLEGHHSDAISDYFIALREFLIVEPTGRSMIVQTLSMLYQSIEVGSSNTEYLPYTLFAGSIKRFIENVHIQNSLFTSDAEAVAFFETAKGVLSHFFDEIELDIQQVISNARQQLDDLEK